MESNFASVLNRTEHEEVDFISNGFDLKKKRFSLVAIDSDWDLELETSVNKYQNSVKEAGKYEDLKMKILDNIAKIDLLGKYVEKINEEDDANEEELMQIINRMDLFTRVTRQLVESMENDINTVMVKFDLDKQEVKYRSKSFPKQQLDLERINSDFNYFFTRIDEIENIEMIESRIKRELNDAQIFRVKTVEFEQRIEEELSGINERSIAMEELRWKNLMKEEFKNEITQLVRKVLMDELNKEKPQFMVEVEKLVDVKLQNETSKLKLDFSKKLECQQREMSTQTDTKIADNVQNVESKVDQHVSKLNEDVNAKLAEQKKRTETIISNQNVQIEKMEIRLEEMHNVDKKIESTKNQLTSMIDQRLTNDNKELFNQIEAKSSHDKEILISALDGKIDQLSSDLNAEINSSINEYERKIVSLETNFETQMAHFNTKLGNFKAELPNTVERECNIKSNLLKNEFNDKLDDFGNKMTTELRSEITIYTSHINSEFEIFTREMESKLHSLLLQRFGPYDKLSEDLQAELRNQNSKIEQIANRISEEKDENQNGRRRHLDLQEQLVQMNQTIQKAMLTGFIMLMLVASILLVI